MNSFVDEVLTGDPKYTLTYNDNTQATNVEIVLSTPVQTQGTALNKAFFDSIQTDLNTRLLASQKATGSEVQTGTNNTKYITPLSNKQAKQGLITTKSVYATGSAVAQTIFDFSTASGNIIEISGTYGEVNTSSNQTISLVGTQILGASQNNLSITEYDFRYVTGSNGSFYFRFDLSNNTFIAMFSARTSGSTTKPDYVVGRFTTLTSLTATLRGSASQSTYVNATISQNF